MTRSRLISAFVLAAALLWGAGLHSAAAQERSSAMPRVSPNATLGQTVGVTDVTITYGRPSVRGRTIFGELVPYGEVWRTGANEATTITFSTPVTVQDQSLPAGTYAFFTIPGPDEWTLVLNDTPEQWGVYDYDETKDAIRVTVSPESASMQEMMTFHVPQTTDSSATISLRWAETAVPFTVTAAPGPILMERARAEIPQAEDWQTPYRYASYALDQETNLDEAMQWADSAVQMEKNFNTMALKARMQAKMGDYAAAAETGTAAVELGEAAEQAPNGLDRMKEMVEGWKGQS